MTGCSPPPYSATGGSGRNVAKGAAMSAKSINRLVREGEFVTASRRWKPEKPANKALEPSARSLTLARRGSSRGSEPEGTTQAVSVLCYGHGSQAIACRGAPASP